MSTDQPEPCKLETLDSNVSLMFVASFLISQLKFTILACTRLRVMTRGRRGRVQQHYLRRRLKQSYELISTESYTNT
jgi:hypothetical protein